LRENFYHRTEGKKVSGGRNDMKKEGSLRGEELRKAFRRETLLMGFEKA